MWDCTTDKTYAVASLYFVALDFAALIEEGMLRTVPLNVFLDWMSRPQGPKFIENPPPAKEVNPPCLALLGLVEPRTIYGIDLKAPQPAMIGLSIVFKPPYMRAVSFSRIHN